MNAIFYFMCLLLVLEFALWVIRPRNLSEAQVVAYWLMVLFTFVMLVTAAMTGA